jgi:hypothetical protein
VRDGEVVCDKFKVMGLQTTNGNYAQYWIISCTIVQLLAWRYGVKHMEENIYHKFFSEIRVVFTSDTRYGKKKCKAQNYF